MSERRQPYLGALVVAGIAVACCGLPVLLSAGVATTLAGIGLRNWIVVLVGGAVAVIGLARIWRSHGRHSE